MDMIKVEFDETFSPFVVSHNMPCAICYREKAVFEIQKQYFTPCWNCREYYKWQTIRLNWLGRFLGKWIRHG